MVKSMITGTLPSSGPGGITAEMAESEETAEEHSTLGQQLPVRLEHPALAQKIR